MKKLLTAATVCCLLGSPLVNADVISYGSLSRDTVSNIVVDSSSGLEWLQWSETDGESISSALSTYGSGGWRVASLQEVAGLFNLMTSNQYDFLNYDSVSMTQEEAYELYGAAAAFSELFGINVEGIESGFSYSGSSGVFSEGGSYGMASVDVWHMGGDPAGTGVFTMLSLPGGESGYGGIGVALVRNSFNGPILPPVAAVPEPETYAMFSIGLIGLYTVRRRKIKASVA